MRKTSGTRKSPDDGHASTLTKFEGRAHGSVFEY